MANDMNDIELLKYMQKHFAYNKENGNFYTVIPQSARNKVGDMVGRVQSNGYVRISIKRKFYQAHRLVWLWHNNSIPSVGIDHINNIKHDNRIENLRPADQALNSRNVRKARRNSRTGVLGVRIKNNKYTAAICCNGKIEWLGTYTTAEEASAAYWRAKSKLHCGAII